MKTNDSASHSQNVSNFGILVTIVPTFGEAYNPPVEALTLPELKNTMQHAQDAISLVTNAEIAHKNLASARMACFDDLDSLTTRTINSLRISGVSDQTLKQAEALVREIRGKRASDKLTDEELSAEKAKGNEVTQVSKHNASYDSKTANFGKYILFLSSITQYKPNEAELQAEALTALQVEMMSKSNEVNSAFAQLDAARQTRNKVLYAEGTGMVAVAQNVKLYVKSAFGASSAQYKQISNITFSNLR